MTSSPAEPSAPEQPTISETVYDHIGTVIKDLGSGLCAYRRIFPGYWQLRQVCNKGNLFRFEIR